MKGISFLSFLFLAIGSFGQGGDYVVDFVDEEPQFPGGEKAMIQFINDSIQYPLEAQAKGQEGVVYVQFVVRKTGEISDIVVMKGVSDMLNAEAVAIIEKMPNWLPGEQKGKKVNVRYTLPISFKMAPGDKKNAKKELRKRKNLDRNPNVIDY